MAQIPGERLPFELPTQIPKSDARHAARHLLIRSFDYGIEKIAAFTPAQLDRIYKVDWFGRPEISGRLLVLGMHTHTAHHRGQAEVYLRAKGITPPAYRF